MGGVMDGSSRNRDDDGNLYVRYLYFENGQWNWGYNWLDNYFDDQNPAAILASLFISPLIYFQGSFVLQVVRATLRAFFRFLLFV